MRTRGPFVPAMLGSALLVGCADPSSPAAVAVTITSPVAGASALAGDTVVLAGHAASASGTGILAAITWSTGTEGVLGTGDTVRVAFMTPGARVITATVDLDDGGQASATRALAVLPNAVPVFTSVAVPPRAFDRDTIPLVAQATDAESGVEIAWLDGSTEIGRGPSGDTLWWTPGGPPGDRDVVARALDVQGFASDSTLSLRVADGTRVKWSAVGTHRAYGRSVITDWGAVTALHPAGDIAVGFFYNGGNGGDTVWVFDPTGAARWHASAGGFLGDHSAGLTFAPDGSLFTMVFGGWLTHFAPDGTPLWSRQGVANDPHGRFALDPDGALYVAANGTAGGMLARLDPDDGSEIWRVEVPQAGYSAGPAVLSDGSITAQLGATLVRVAPDSTPRALQLAAPLASYMSAADARGMAYLAARSPDQGLVAVASDNTVQWNAPSGTGAEVAEPAIDRDTVLYTATRSGSETTVLAVGPDGAMRWRQVVPLASYIPRLAVLADGSVLVTAAFTLYRFDRTSGTLLDTVEFPESVESALAVADDGTVYLVIADGRVLAINGWAPLDPDAPWPIWRRDNRRTASVPRP